MEDAASFGTSLSTSVESYAPDFSPAATEFDDTPLEQTVDGARDEEASADADAKDVPTEIVDACTAPVESDAAGHGEPVPERIIEAILFSSDSPLTPARLADVAGLEKPAAVVDCIDKLNAQYASLGLAFRIEKIARGYQLMTLASYQPYVARLHQQAGESRLSDAALETLSIIAYKQPIIRADVEAIRGVAAGDGINRLRAIGLVKIVGRAEIVGRPILYGTTKKFLDMFGLADLGDLPPLEALRVRPATKPDATAIDSSVEERNVDAKVA